MVDAVAPLVGEIIVITDTKDNQRTLSQALSPSIHVLVDELDLRSPVVGALTGFKHAKGGHSLLLSCKMPLISRDVVSLLLEVSTSYNLVIPRWPSGDVEPLQAAYNTKVAYEASQAAVTARELDMNDILSKLRNTLYISSAVLSQLNSKLTTFLKINTPVILNE